MSKNNGRYGVGVFDLLTLLFVGLKLAGVIDWSWWLVLSPMLFSLSCAVAYVLLKRWGKL